jgi:hypothetical protein
VNGIACFADNGFEAGASSREHAQRRNRLFRVRDHCESAEKSAHLALRSRLMSQIAQRPIGIPATTSAPIISAMIWRACRIFMPAPPNKKPLSTHAQHSTRAYAERELPRRKIGGAYAAQNNLQPRVHRDLQEQIPIQMYRPQKYIPAILAKCYGRSRSLLKLSNEYRSKVFGGERHGNIQRSRCFIAWRAYEIAWHAQTALVQNETDKASKVRSQKTGGQRGCGLYQPRNGTGASLWRRLREKALQALRAVQNGQRGCVGHWTASPAGKNRALRSWRGMAFPDV